MQITWTSKGFHKLSLSELYAILQLRSEVFVVEQQCPFLDMDGKDECSEHIMAFDEKGILSAYSRIIPAGFGFKEISIGRIVSSPRYRGQGLGEALVRKSIARVYEQQKQVIPIRIGAQARLTNFYQKFGFVVDSDEYLEDGIVHIEMIKIN